MAPLDELGRPGTPTVNWIVHGIIGIGLAIIGTLTNRTLDTVREVATVTAVQQVEIKHITDRLDLLQASINAASDSRYPMSEGKRLEKELDDVRTRIRRQWDTINSIRATNGQSPSGSDR